MTKQFKKGLIAVLVVLMAVLVGFTANSVIGASQATEKPASVVAFENSVKLLPDLTTEQQNKKYLLTGIMGNKQTDADGNVSYDNMKYAIDVWNAYNGAKLQIPDLSKFEHIDLIDAEYLNRFTAYDAILGTKAEGEEYSTYAQLLRFSVDMKQIAEKMDPYITYDASHEKVETLGADITTWGNEKDVSGSIYYYIYNSSAFYREYYRALDRMNQYKETFANIGKLVEAIEYYDVDATTLKGSDAADMYNPEDPNHIIVLDSETSIKAVEEKLATLADVDYKYITGTDEQFNLEKYNAASNALKVLKDKIAAVEGLIDVAYGKISTEKDNEIYYTVRDSIKAAEEAYNALKLEAKYEGGVETAKNYNDLAGKVTNVAKLTEMTAYLNTLDTERIPAVEKLIAYDELNKKGIPELTEASYNIDYRTAIENAERALKVLDNDIKEHDAQVYAIKTAIAEAEAKMAELQAKVNEIKAKHAEEGYDAATDADKEKDEAVLNEYKGYADVVAAKTEELKFDDAYMPEGKDYIVAGYDKLQDSRKQYDAWTDYIKGLLEKVKEVITLQQGTGDGVSALLGEVLNAPFYTTVPWQGKDPVQHQNAFLYAAAKEGDEPIYIADDNYGDRYDFLIKDSPYPPRDDETTPVTAYEVLSYFYMIKGEIQNTVSKIEGEIAKLANAVEALEGKCVYGERDTLLNIWDEYCKLEHYVPGSGSAEDAIDLRHWVSNYRTLEAMHTEFVEEDKLVKLWAATIADIKLPVNVAGFDAIATAEEAYKAIIHYVPATEPALLAEGTEETVTADFGAFLAEAGMANHGEIVLDYSKEYDTYSRAIAARNTLKKTIDDLAKDMRAINTDDSASNLPLNQVVAWTNAVDAITARYEAIADMVKDAEGKEVANIAGDIDYTGAQQYLIKNHGAAHANYKKALRLIERYKVEAAIEELPAPEAVTLAKEVVDAIDNAWLLHDNYLKKYHTSEAENTDEWRATPPHNDFRNDQKLHDCIAKINAINQELNAWMIEVIKLYNKDFPADSNITEIKAELAKAAEFSGYPLDLDAWKAVSDKYAALVGEDVDKIDYVKAASDVLGKMSKVDESGNVIDESTGLYGKSDKVIETLNNDIKTLSDRVNVEGYQFTADDVNAVTDIQKRYNELHKTQQAKVVGYNDILLDARDTLVAVEALKSMVKSLYAEVVTKNNITSYVQFYIDVVKTTYAQFPTDIRQSFDVEGPNFIAPNGYTKNLEEIQAAYDKALKEGTVVRLSELKAAFEQAQKELIDALNGLSTLAEGDTSSALKDAFVKFEKRITDAYTGLINEKVSALKTELEALIKAGDDKLAADLAAAKTELENALKTETANRVAALDEVNNTIATLKTELETKITEQINALEAKLQGVIDAEKAAREDGDTAAANALKTAREALEASIKEAKDAIAKESTDRAAEIAALKTELQGVIDAEKKAREDGDTAAANALKTAREALEKSIADANAAIAKEAKDRADALADVLAKANDAQEAVNKLRADMEKADAELKQQIDDLKSTTTTLTILVIVLVVMVLAALACIILLFIKRK